MSRALVPVLALAVLVMPGCKTLDEVAIGYADAIATTTLPGGDAAYTGATVGFPALADLDPLSSPALSRYEVAPDEVESVKVTRVELEGPEGACGLPFSKLELQVVSVELGAASVATASGDCVEWTLSETELGPWFRQPAISIVLLVDGQPWAGAADSLSLRVSFLVDVDDKPIH